MDCFFKRTGPHFDNKIGTEELAHLEMVGSIVHQLLDGVTAKQLREAGLDARYVEHGLGIYPSDANGVPFSAAAFQSKGDPITDLYEDLAADGATGKEQQRNSKSLYIQKSVKNMGRSEYIIANVRPASSVYQIIIGGD